jgi:tRNA nucleotidyltransferase (CCA-adding enzyme)
MMKALAKRVRTEVSPERIWQEVSKALEEKSPWLFLNTLCEIFEVPTAGNKTFGLEEVGEKGVVDGSIWTVFLLHLSTTDAARISNAVRVPASFRKLFHDTLAIFRAPEDLSAEGHLATLIRLKALHENTPLIRVLITLSAILPPDEIDALITRWLNVLSAARSVTSTDLTRRGFAGKLLGSKMREARIKKIEEVLSHGS